MAVNKTQTESSRDSIRLSLMALSRLARIRAAIDDAQTEFFRSVLKPLVHPEAIEAEEMAFYDLLTENLPILRSHPVATALMCLHSDFTKTVEGFIGSLEEAIAREIPDSLRDKFIIFKISDSLQYEIKKYADNSIAIWEVHDPLGTPKRKDISL